MPARCLRKERRSSRLGEAGWGMTMRQERRRHKQKRKNGMPVMIDQISAMACMPMAVWRAKSSYCTASFFLLPTLRVCGGVGGWGGGAE
ncbi:uncharacterized protein K452DRAFT_157700 [Aplosporella prunicola CBS 121167]|uniref:Uncharacterized protein n=1 Tax=Aplosporella prunicola CBS 121167 TaxID=1176127 RepID=A0A6A6AZI2_9PEZI|nr:uncharacterized protein K452DRAFT_157700 [Aplosporella prunicola CBS 121167]KAF2135881.1 hypothetical protein K452DRAFT_157700 [Aplosporella prunicola CBS 121167]